MAFQSLDNLDVQYDDKVVGNLISPFEWNQNFKLIEQIVNGNNLKIMANLVLASFPYSIGNTFTTTNNVLNVDVTNQMTEGSSKPITSGAVYNEVGNIHVLLQTI